MIHSFFLSIKTQSNQSLEVFVVATKNLLKRHYLRLISFLFQMLNAAWDVGIPLASENALSCHDRVGYNKILDNAKPATDPDGRHLSSFTYLRLSPHLMESDSFMEFERFVKRMHGKTL